VRAVVPVGFAAALAGGNVCDSGPTAYVRAQLGDTVLVAGGTYTSQWFFTRAMKKTGPDGTCDYNYGGSANFSDCVTFKPAPGAVVNFAVPSPSPNAQQTQIDVCVPYVAIEGFTFTETDHGEATTGDTLSNIAVAVGSGDNTCGTSSYPHDVYLANNTYGGQVEVTGSVYNVWVVGGTAASATNRPWQFGGETSTSPSVYVNHSGISGVVFQGSSFAATDLGNHHMVCVIANGSDHLSIADDRFLNCPVYGFETGQSTTNLLIENNYFSGSTVHLQVNGLNSVQSNNTIRFNSFYGSVIDIVNKCNNGATTSICTGQMTNNVIYSNINTGCPPILFGQGGMTGTGWSCTASLTGAPIAPASSTTNRSATTTTNSSAEAELSSTRVSVR